MRVGPDGPDGNGGGGGGGSPPDGGSTGGGKLEVKDADALRGAGRQFHQAAGAIDGLQGKTAVAQTVGAALPGSDTAKGCEHVDDAIKGLLKQQGAWLDDVAGKVLDAVETTTHVDERSAAGMPSTHDPHEPKPGDGQPQPTNPPGDPPPSPDPAPGDGPPMDVPGKGASNVPIDPGQVEYDPKGAGDSGPAAVDKYIDQALDVMHITDPQQRAQWKKGYETLLARESSNNSPNWLVNTTDRNAVGAPVADGHPAGCTRGCGQLTPGNFATYHQPGTSNNMYDPVASICASMNYVMTDPHYNNPATGYHDKPVSRDGHDFITNIQQADESREKVWY